jgi:hypothetical protein
MTYADVYAAGGGSGAVLDGGGGGHRLGEAALEGAVRDRRADLRMVFGRDGQHLLERGGPARGGGRTGEQVAIIYDSPVTHTKHTITYAS